MQFPARHAPRDAARAPRDAARAPRDAEPRDAARAPRDAEPRDAARAPRDAGPRDAGPRDAARGTGEARVRRALRTAVTAAAVAALALTATGLLHPARASAAAPTPPTLASYRALPSAVDDTTGAADATLVVRVQDTGPGFAQGTVTLAAGTTTLGPFGFDDTDRVSGSALDGTYDVPVTVPQGTAAGAYTGSVYLEDLSGTATTVAGTAALTVTRASDTTPPSLLGLTATPNAVDTTSAQGTVTYSAHVTDAGSGVASVSLNLAGPNGESDTVPLEHDGGTAADGTWTAPYTVATWTDPGSWTVASATLADAFGNTSTVTTGLSGATVTVTQQADTTPPTLGPVTLDRSSVDVSDSDQVVHARVAASDDLSGVASGYLAFTEPTSGTQVDGVFTVDPSVPENGTYTADITVPALSQPGTYALTDLQVVDNQGNTTELCTPPVTDGYDTYSSCDGTPPPLAITVTDTVDTTPPTLAHLTLGPSTVTTAYAGAARVDGSFDVADAVSGFAEADVTLSDGSGTRTLTLGPDDLARGTVHSGTVVFSTYLDSTDAGTWAVTGVVLTDLAGNSVTLSGAALGSPGTVTVGTAATDTAPPALTSLAVSPSAVDTTAAGQDVAVTATISDAQAGAVASGLASATATLRAPNGMLVVADLDQLVAGNSVTGTFSGTAAIPQYAPAGLWTVVDVSLTDAAGLTRDYPAGSAALTPATVTVTSATDTQAPTLTAVTVPAAVDASTAGRAGVQVPVHLGATDAGSGIDQVSVTVTAPDGTPTTVSSTVDPATQVSTDLSLTVPGFDSAGTWTVTGVELDTVAGPSLVLDAAGLANQGLVPHFAVTAPQDTTPPAVTGVDVTPSPISTAAAAVDADVLVHLTDAGSGVSTGWVTLTSPHGYQSLSTGLTLVAGDAGDGWWQGAVTLPRYVDPGTWQIGVSALDAAGNGTDASASALAALGLTGTVTVTGQADASPPVLAGLALGGTTVDLSSLGAPAAQAVSVTATDSGSGVAEVDVSVTAPDGSVRTISTDPTATSTPAAAEYAGTIALPLTSPGGTWSIGPITVHDLSGNVATYTHAQLLAAHFPSAFTVNAATQSAPPPTATAPAAPPAPTANLSGSAGVTVSWSAPAANGGAAVTGYVLTPYRNGSAGTSVTTPNLSASLSGLVKGATYTFTVQAVNLVGASPASAASPAVTIPTTVPSAPAISSAVVTGTTATVTFSPPADNGGLPVLSYAVTPWTGTTPGVPVTVPSSATTATLPGLVQGHTYTFTATATNAHGAGPASAASAPVAVAATPPDAPTTLAAVQPAGTDSLVVSWARPAVTGGAPVTGFVLTPYRDGTAQSPITLGNVVSTILSPLVSGSAYTFTVAAVNSAGTGVQSGASDPVTAVAVPPGSPTGVAATRSGSAITVTWAAPADSGGAPLTGYVLTPFAGSTALAVHSTGTATRTVLSLPAGASYTFTVAAQNLAGAGARSNPSAPVTVVAPTALASSAATAQVTYGAAARVTGRLTRSDTGQALAGRPVQLQARAAGSTAAFTVAARGTTSAAGTVTFASFRPARSVDLRLIYLADGAFGGSVSPTRTVAVAPVVTIATSTMRSGHTLRLTGTVSPALPGRAMYLQRRSGSHWITVASGTLSARGTYAVTTRPSARGTSTYRVVLPAGGGVATATSAARSVTVG